MILTFENFVNEELNLSYETHDNFTEIVFEDRWFQYDSDDDIIYGYNHIPTDLSKGFTFKPNECVVYVDKKMIKYDINNPICIISYDLDTSTIKVFTDKSLDYLKHLDSTINGDFEQPNTQRKIQNIINQDDNKHHLVIYGNKLISSTFDIIEEN